MNHLDYIEREAGKNIEFHLENVDSLNKESHTTLSFLFVVVSATFAGSARLFESQAKTGWALALGVLCLYLSSLAVLLTIKCLKAGVVMPPSNEPENLMRNLAEYSLDQIREVELENLQERINFNQLRNAQIGQRLNNVRLGICLAPLVFVLAVGIAFIISRLAAFQWF